MLDMYDDGNGLAAEMRERSFEGDKQARNEGRAYWSCIVLTPLSIAPEPPGMRQP